MTALLYPRLPRPVSAALAGERHSLSVRDAAQASATSHAHSYYAATGGQRTGESELRTLQDAVRALAVSLGYPDSAARDQKQLFDRGCAALLHRTMGISAHEAAQHGMWEFLCCVLLPDIVRWRWLGTGETTHRARFLGGVRNTFSRLWWRAEILLDEESGRPYRLVDALGEDEAVQILERPVLAANRDLARATVHELLRLQAMDGPHARIASRRRSEVLRDVQKRLLRTSGALAMELLTPEQARAVVRAELLETCEALGRQPAPNKVESPVVLAG